MTMTYEELAATKNATYKDEAGKLIKAAISAADATEREVKEKFDALYAAKRALDRAIEIVLTQDRMKHRNSEGVIWTIQEVITTCRDMDGDCESCPLYSKENKRCFRARDNGIAGASSPASWDLKYSPELRGTPAGNWIEEFRDSHACECCPPYGGHYDVTDDRMPGRCNCRMTRVPGEWR